MLDPSLAHHLQRLRAATTQRLGRKDLPEWIERNTTINGRPFSFKKHEYQQQILLDESPEIVIRKSAQTGISEMSMRMSLAMLMIMPGAFRIGYTFPTATFAASYSKSRLNPIILGSPALSAAVTSADLDSAEVKTLGVGKELYFKGAATGNAAISTTLDLLIHDELSFSDPDVIGDYWSRVLHSDYKWRISLSTPTFVGDAIDTAFTNSRRHWNFCRCEHCSHRFIPDFYENVFVPGIGGGLELDRVNANNLHTVRHKEAEFRCPKCQRQTSLLPKHREWVCENPQERHIAAGYQVQPFDAPLVVSLSDLIIASTKYASKSKFKQFSLGRPATDSDSGITDEDMMAICLDHVETSFRSHVLGVDLGIYCHFMIGGVASDGTLVVVHYERVALKDFRRRYAQLVQEYRITVKVSDIQPYTELIMSLSESDQNLYGARYVTRQGLEVYDVKQEDPDRENAIEGVREVSVNRNALFDKLLSAIRPEEFSAPKIMIRRLNDWELLKAHFLAMRRAKAQLRNGEFTSVWQKPADGQDHYMHAMGYLWVASQMRGIAAGYTNLGIGVSKFKVIDPTAPKRR